MPSKHFHSFCICVIWELSRWPKSWCNTCTGLVELLRAAGWGFSKVQCYDQRRCREDWTVLLRFCLVLSVPSITKAFASLLVGYDFDSAYTYLKYCRSAEVLLLFINVVHRWFLYVFANGCELDLVEQWLPYWREVRGRPMVQIDCMLLGPMPGR